MYFEKTIPVKYAPIIDVTWKNSSLINAIAKHNISAYSGILCLCSLFILRLFINGGKNFTSKNANIKNNIKPIIIV